jgi:hypothetical protein
MNITKVTVAMTVVRPNGPFKSEASMLDWMSLCLNCNTNNAAVVLEKISPPSMAGGGLWRINDAFESVNDCSCRRRYGPM